MNILVIGSGGREHALSWKISQSEQCDKLFIAPGNAGTALLGTNINLGVNDFNGIAEFISSNSIQLVVVGPEDPLVKGIRNFLESDERTSKVGIVGPGKDGAQLEGSKDFSKRFMNTYQIPTAKFETFTKESIDKAYEFLKSMSPPYVLKADGLAAGKGVIISPSLDEAYEALKEMLIDEKFGLASNRVLIEEFLEGIEVSVFVLSDGKNYVVLPEAKDYKRIGEGDTGLNTGGMGAISPVHFADEEFMEKVSSRIIKPTINGLNTEGIDYKGFIFIGLMNVNGNPYVIEYNVRMGDPETQAVLTRINSDFVELLNASANGTLSSKNIELKKEFAATVVMVSGGYPGSYDKGDPISGLNSSNDVMVFHAGTKQNGKEIVSNGGRVLAVTALGKDIEKAVDSCYNRIDGISWKDSYYRKDIGKDLMN